jgi:uncharacterized protein (TIGR02145 family)
MTVVLLSSVVLSAQTNGVTVENLVVNIGSPSTVTFNVSWAPLTPPAVWSDSVWVFVDHNVNGTMERLELLSSGATLTATSAPDVGRVEQLAGNIKGVRVIGNARTNSSFSATVQLLTTTTNVAGACAYASNYPPVAEYATASSITFTGAPPFDLVLSTGGQISVQTGYELVGGQTLVSFTDKTGAPGIIKCIPPATYSLIASASGFCASDAGITFSLDDTQSGVKYQLYRSSDKVGNELTGNGSAQTFTGGPLKVAGVYTAQSVAESGYCAMLMTGSHNIVAYSAISPGSITTATETTDAGTAPSATITSTEDASGGSGNLAYEWRRTTGTSTTTLSGAASSYALSSDNTNYSTAGTYYFNRYAKDAACSNAVWVAAYGTYTLGVDGCSFSQPAVLTTFANFHNTSEYSSSTFVTLMDERDNKNYTVVKIGGRWIMAQNLNYQGVANTSSSLTWQATPNSPSTVTGSNPALIGSFWCPGRSGSTVLTPTLESCNVWGALYSWETAMSLDGKGAWSYAITNYCGTNFAASHTYCKQNWGRTSSGQGSGGRGICPVNWHVPTYNEWAVMFDAMESEGGTVHQNSTIHGYIGIDASARAKSICTCPPDTPLDVGCLSETTTHWRYSPEHVGRDHYGLRLIPTGMRHYDGSTITNMHSDVWLQSSTASNAGHAWSIRVYYDKAGVYRSPAAGSTGLPVRCIKN